MKLHEVFVFNNGKPKNMYTVINMKTGRQVGSINDVVLLDANFCTIKGKRGAKGILSETITPLLATKLRSLQGSERRAFYRNTKSKLPHHNDGFELSVIRNARLVQFNSETGIRVSGVGFRKMFNNELLSYTDVNQWKIEDDVECDDDFDNLEEDYEEDDEEDTLDW